MPAEAHEQARTLLADLKLSLAENTKALAEIHDDEPKPWIVMSSHDLPMHYTDGRVRPTSVCKATRFALQRQADVMALNTHDGTGEPFVSVHILFALQRAIRREQAIVEDIEKVLARTQVTPE
jgi:hypothetical protein